MIQQQRTIAVEGIKIENTLVRANILVRMRLEVEFLIYRKLHIRGTPYYHSVIQAPAFSSLAPVNHLVALEAETCLAVLVITRILI